MNKDSLRQQVERLIIENRNFLNDPTTNEPYDVKGIADDVVALIQQTNIEARIDELSRLENRVPTSSHGNTARAYISMIEQRLSILKAKGIPPQLKENKQ